MSLHAPLANLSQDRTLDQTREDIVRRSAERDTLAAARIIPIEKLITHTGPEQSVYLPTAFALSSLFAPSRRGAHETLTQANVFHLWSTMQIIATGPLLNWGDCVAFMSILTFCRQRKLELGKRFQCRSTDLLRICHPQRNNFGQHDTEWLKNSLIRLNKTSIFVRHNPQQSEAYQFGEYCPFYLIKETQIGKNSALEILLDARLAYLLSREQYIVVNSIKLQELNTELAKFLYLLILGNKSTEQKFELQLLCQRLHYTSPIRSIKCRLNKAFEQLAKANIITCYSWSQHWNPNIRKTVPELWIEKHLSIVPHKKPIPRS